VKNGFVVKDKVGIPTLSQRAPLTRLRLQETQESKGVGYVTFTSKDDAEKAVQDLNGGQFGADAKRKIRVEMANDKVSIRFRRLQAVSDPSQPFVPRRRAADADIPELPGAEVTAPIPTPRTKPVQPRGHAAAGSAGNSDKFAIRTIVLSGIPTDVDRDTLWKKVRKMPGIGPKEGLEYPATLDSVVAGEVKETMGNTAHVLFENHDKASKAAEKLHSHIYKGALLSCVLKKRLQVAAGKVDGKGGSRAGRLIIRNLAWNVSTKCRDKNRV
jgi:nucleolar protein 4